MSPVVPSGLIIYESINQTANKFTNKQTKKRNINAGVPCHNTHVQTENVINVLSISGSHISNHCVQWGSESSYHL